MQNTKKYGVRIRSFNRFPKHRRHHYWFASFIFHFTSQWNASHFSISEQFHFRNLSHSLSSLLLPRTYDLLFLHLFFLPSSTYSIQSIRLWPLLDLHTPSQSLTDERAWRSERAGAHSFRVFHTVVLLMFALSLAPRAYGCAEWKW